MTEFSVPQKQCSICKESKPEYAFYIVNRKVMRLRAECKTCTNKLNVRSRTKPETLARMDARIASASVAEKQCIRCLLTLSIDQFNLAKGNKDGRNNRCKKCKANDDRIFYSRPEKRELKRAYDREYYQREHVKVKQSEKDRRRRGLIDQRAMHLKKQYNMTRQDYDEMLNAQNSCCAICERHMLECSRSILVVDHCHKTNKVRGLLCVTCNIGIGGLQDEIAIIQKAAQYLGRFT